MNSFSYAPFIVLFFILVLTGCRAQEPHSLFNDSIVEKGDLAKQGESVRLHKVEELRLDTEDSGFMIQMDRLIYRNGHFYAIGRISPEIVVYDRGGKHLKTLEISPRPKPGCAFADLSWKPGDRLLVKDINASEILEIDSAGKVVFRISTGSTGKDGDIQIAHGGLMVVETQSGSVIFSTVFQWMDLSRVLRETYVVGRFNKDGVLEKLFAKRDPLISDLGLFAHQPTTFTVYADKLYLLEEPLPFIRVFSLEGDFIRRFGAKSPSHRQLEPQPHDLSSIPETLRFIRRHTLHRRIDVIRSVRGLKGPILAVYYYNVILKEENLTRESSDVEQNNYLAIYTLEGQLLANDIDLPGRLMDVSEESELVILLKDRPDHRVIGFYSLSVEPAGGT